MREAEAELLIVDGTVSPIQQKNLEEAVKGKVIDRTGLILEIFGERAATAEGRLQVELAHLDYQAGRLVRSWTHLERQRGGFGFLGGPGETQIEADRRLIRDRMAKLKRELEQVTRTRSLHRSRRQKAPWPVIALVGYTNAGKSTLFNRLTRSDVFAENLLFATLDPTMREIALPGLPKAILSDTVGFISDLPTQLVAAFRATLEEVLAADIIVHVRDISHPDSDAQREDVEQVLKELGVLHGNEDGEAGEESAPMIEAWNKIDLLDGDNGPDAPTDVTSERSAILAEAERREDVVVLSALSGEGVDDLLACAAAHLRKDSRRQEVTLAAGDGEALAWLHQHGEVLHQESEGMHTRLVVKIAPAEWERFQARR
ncbi:MAG: hflX [Alphaproteobacteria bacterium]|nr:hflX [Alphaproteobacteria bacterium]